MTDNFDKVRQAMGFKSDVPKAVESSVAVKPSEGVVFKPRADSNIVKATQTPTRMAMKIGVADNKLTIELEKETGWMQFDKATAWNFIKTLQQYARSLT